MAKIAPIAEEPDEVEQVKSRRRATVVRQNDAKEQPLSTYARFQQKVHWLTAELGLYDSPQAIAIRKFIRGTYFGGVMVFCLIAALFLGEICIIAQASTNTVQDTILTIVMVLFTIEFTCLSLTDIQYVFSFFFWMDIIGTISMIMDISYLAGSDATQVVQISKSNGSSNVIVIRAARAAKLAARAGRLSRVMKILRFLPGIRGKEEEKVKMARFISNQLATVLSTRVAFLTILIVVILPLFSLFNYPENDDSMSAWSELLDNDATNFYSALKVDPFFNGNAVYAKTRLTQQVGKLMDFYQGMDYGPFFFCYGSHRSGGFTCDSNNTIVYNTGFTRPKQNSSIQEVVQDHIAMYFDLSSPRKQESVSGIFLVMFIVVVMCVFGLLISNSISNVALKPLERMLSVVRERCKEIFKYTTELQDDESEDEEDSHDQDMEHSSEFQLLEKVVGKLAAIAHLSTANQEPEIKENMTENEIMAINWMQGAQVAKMQSRAVRPSLQGSEGSSDVVVGVTVVTAPRNELTSVLGKISPTTFELLASDSFDALDPSQDLKIAIGTYITLYHEGSANWVREHVPEQVVYKFVSNVEAKYPENYFHNFSHGLDVLYQVSRSMRLTAADSFLAEHTQFWLLIAAIAHDVGHLGWNNQFLIETTHELAVKYNDRAPMENMHCALLFQITSASPDANIFAKLDKELYKEMRKGIIAAILHTDMIKHNEMIKELSLLYQMNSDSFDSLHPETVIEASTANLQLILNCFLHSADIGNPMKPWKICERYAHLCLDEFFAQGDKEKLLGIPVQMLNDRDKVNRPNSQIGFIEFVITPMAESLVNLFPQLDAMALNLESNVLSWYNMWVDEASPPEDASSKVKARVDKIGVRCKAVTREFRNIDY